MGKVFHSPVKLKGTAVDGANDPIVTRDATTFDLGTIPALSGTFLSTTLTSGNIIVGNSSNVATSVTMSGDGTINNTGVFAIASGVIVNADVSASAAVAYSKLNLTGGIVNADVNASAAITYSKLNLTGGIVNADVSASAAITRTKLANGTAYRILANDATGIFSEHPAITVLRALASDSNGQIVASATTATQLGYLSTTTSDVQTQINTKVAGKATNAIAQNPTITQDGYAITWDNTAGEYTLTDPVVQGIPVGGTARQALVKNSGTNYDASWSTLLLTDIPSITAVTADLNLLAGANAGGLTSTEIMYVNGVTSAIQTQLDAKQSSALAQNAMWVGNSSGLAAQLAGGTNGYVLTSVSGAPQWQPNTAGTPPGSNTQVIFNDSSAYGADAGLTYDKATDTLTVTNLLSVAGNATAAGQLRLYEDTDNGTNYTAFQVGVQAGNVTYTLPTADGTSGYFLQTNGSGVLSWAASGGISGLTTNRVPYATSSTTLGDDSAFTWDATNNALTIDSQVIHATGTGNIFIGASAGNFTLTGTNNTCFGESSGNALTSGNGNTFIGISAGLIISSGANNTAVGNLALDAASTASSNTAIGSNALGAATGSSNIGIGAFAGDNIGSGSNNIIIGTSIDAQNGGTSDQLSIANAIFGSGNSATGTTVSNGNLGFYATSWGTSAAKVLAWGVGTAPTTSPADSIQLWAEDVAASAELRVRDEAGNVTTLSPHNFSLIGEPSEEMAWAYYSEKDGKKINVDMLKLARWVEKLSGDKLVYIQ